MGRLRGHHVPAFAESREPAFLDQAPAPGGHPVEVRRFGCPNDPRPERLSWANRSESRPCKGQEITGAGAGSWLRIKPGLGRTFFPIMPLADGSGRGARSARRRFDARAEHLVDEGLGQRQGQRIILQRNLLATLRRRELDAMGQRLEAETGLPNRPAKSGEHVSGTYTRQLRLSSGRYAMIEGIDPDGGRIFQLVPWSREIEPRLGQHITGIARSGGGIDWTLGRKRGLGI